ncbi:hypothetical protein LJB99_06760 [Deltaproteobacteria bacterium OttesenSCG-928-K17]|nr:hypothetical protein [Deltaproteobacteria bacterium OttesenSCG-928-K17]
MKLLTHSASQMSLQKKMVVVLINPHSISSAKAVQEKYKVAFKASRGSA